MPYILLFLLLIAEQHFEVTVVVNNDSDKVGVVYLAVFNTTDDFLDPDKAFLKDSISTEGKKVTFKIDSLPKGDYAITVILDENNNQKLDKNFIGIPTEQFGFSNNPSIMFGPPSFKEAAVNVDSNKTIQIELK